MIIHQSLCGENKNKAWDLLKTTMSDLSLAKSLAFRTDLHDEAGGITWRPTIRGYFENNYFLLMKTFPDTAPDVRSGRAFSHVLLISKIDAGSIVDLSALFSYFQSEINKEVQLQPIEFSSGINDSQQSKKFKERFNKVINGYVNFKKYKNTIIWVGEEGYEEAVSQFWNILSLEEKYIFNFGIYFNRDAVIENKLNLIMIPENIESKFMNRGFCVIRKGDTYNLSDLSELMIAGDKIANQRLRKFQNEIEAKSISRNDIGRISIVIKTFEEIETVTNLKKIISLSHIISEFSPDQNQGTEFKSKLVEKLSSLIEDSEVNELFLFNKFPIKSFLDCEGEFSKSIKKWIIRNLFSSALAEGKNLEAIFVFLNETSDSSWLSRLIRNEITEFLTKMTPDRALVIIKWLKVNSETFDFIRDKIEYTKEAEICFISMLSLESDEDCFSYIKKIAIERKWYCIYADIIMYQYAPKDAIQEYLNVDKDLNSFEGLERMTKQLAPNSVVDLAILFGENRLIEIAGKLCYANPFLIEKIDITNIHWQMIWISSISNGSKITDGFKDPQTVIFSLFDRFVDGLKPNEFLLHKIAETEFANILEYKNREKIWEIIPIIVKDEFLSKTSFYLLNKLCVDSNVEIPGERVLLDYVENHAISEYIKSYQCNLGSLLRIYFVFKLQKEKTLREYLTYYNEDIDVIDATQLGQLVVENNFTSVASIIYIKARYRSSWRFALEECYTLLGWLIRAEIYVTGLVDNIQITEDQWWEAFAEIAYRLYPGGPKENKIWSEAEGEEYDIQTMGTGKELWITSLKNLRNGSCTGITVEKLLKKMMKAFKNNSELKTLNDLKSKLWNK
ncbi:hypothetical protein LEP1GSC052_0076 [Leptospira phage vb_LkmZ_Bejolso9-LE1]|nr:hypothetical protein LEP1GSC052_0076 [Leptospira phage vb_LkmZ_Bejolso9-LE1]